MKKVLSIVLALAMLLSFTSLAAAEEVVKPEKITIMIDGTVLTSLNGRDAIEARWEELTGIDLVIIQPDHTGYTDQLQQQIVSEEWPDVMILPAAYYSSFAAEGMLWDMTDAWENSETKNSGRFTGDQVFDGLKLDGRLYGFTPTRGNGCLTYIKKAWLDAVGLEAPTTYDEYIAMLEAFATQDPNGNGTADTFGVSAAGFIGAEHPYVNYLPEFYQDAYPSFTKDDSGVWYDGFVLPAMQGALERMADAYKKGLIDPTTLTNGTSDCRNKFYDDTFGAFTYWAGVWAVNLKTNLEANGRDGELVAIPPLAEVGAYFDRVPPVWAISAKCENPEGVFKYFIDTFLDGGDMQMLWTYGAENTHWSTAAATILDVEYKEGDAHFCENLEKAGTLYTKNHVDPMLALATFREDYVNPMAELLLPEALASAEIFNNNSKLAIIVPTTEVMGMYNGDLTTLKNELVAKVIMGEMSYADAMAKFESDGGANWSKQIVDSLNAE